MDGYVCSDTDNSSVSYPHGPEKNSARPFSPLSLLVVVTPRDSDPVTLNLSKAATAAGSEEWCRVCLPTPI